MKNRPPESRVWRNLVVLPSMDVINAEMMTDLGMSIENFSSLQNELRSAIVEKQFDPDASFSLWQHALSRIASTLDRQSRDNFEAWGMGFPCDSDSALPELDAWERVWPELANALRSSQSSAPWGEEIARTYRQDARNSEFERKLEERLTHPLSEWDKRCLSHYSNEDLMSDPSSSLLSPWVLTDSNWRDFGRQFPTVCRPSRKKSYGRSLQISGRAAMMR